MGNVKQLDEDNLRPLKRGAILLVHLPLEALKTEEMGG